MKNRDKLFISIGVVALAATAGLFGHSVLESGIIARDNNPSSVQVQTTDNSSAPSDSTMPNTNTTSTTQAYKDGTYSSKINYYVPHGGSNSISVSLVIKNGIIISASADHTYSDRESGMYVGSFKSSFSSYVAGRDISTFNPSRIGGASLTTAAFDDALTAIRSDAAS